MAVFLYLYTGWSRNLYDFSGAFDSRTRKNKKGFERMLSNFQPSTHRGIQNFKKKFCFGKELKSPLFFKMKYVSFFYTPLDAFFNSPEKVSRYLDE